MTIRFRLLLCALLFAFALTACGAGFKLPPLPSPKPSPAEPTPEAVLSDPAPEAAPDEAAAPDADSLISGNSEQENEQKYTTLLEDCRDVLYADWYLPLTAEDVEARGLCPLILDLGADRDSFGYALRDLNGDGCGELFLGLASPDGLGTLFQLSTVREGSVETLYTATDGDSLALCADDTLLQTGKSADGTIYLFRYALNAEGLIDHLGGLLYSPNAADGPCFTVEPDGTQTPIGEAVFREAAFGMEAQKAPVHYRLIRDYSSQDALQSAVSPLDGDEFLPGLYTRASLSDDETGLHAADVLLPSAWSVRLELDFTSACETPGMATVILESPDGHAAIRLSSEEAYYDVRGDGATPDESGGRTLLPYLDAEGVQPMLLERAGLGGAEALRSLPIPEALWKGAAELAEAKLRSELSEGLTAAGSEGTAARNLYRDENRLLEALCLVAAAETLDETKGEDMIAWSVPLSCLLIADSEESWLQYRGVFETVIANSGFTDELRFVNSRLGAAKETAPTPKQIGQWLKEYADSVPAAQSRRWSEVLDGGVAYETADGQRLNADAGCAGAWQNGDTFFLGAEAPAPTGWTGLERILG